MFFSLDPDDFRHPKRCNLTNGTTVFLNGSQHLHLDCSCAASFPADPTISGPAIMASFFFMSWLSIALAIVPAAYALFGSWRRSHPPYRTLKFAADVLQLRSQGEAYSASHARVAREPEYRDSVASHLALVSEKVRPPSDGASAIFPHVQLNNLTISPQPPFVTFCRRLLYPLCDIQIITGTAMVITGLATYSKITFYSEQFVVNYWWLTLNSLWVSRVDYTTSNQAYAGLRYDLRRLAILASVLMSTIFQGLVAVRESRDWDPTVRGHCYVSTGLGGNDYGQNLFWLTGTALYGLILLVTLTTGCRNWLDARVMSRLEPSLVTMSGWVVDSYANIYAYVASQDRLHHSRARRVVTVTVMAMKTGSYALAWLTWWFLVQFLSIWSSGNGSFVVELVVYSVFAGFATWWIIYLRVQNSTLAQGSQDRWTFAQALPIVLIILATFYAADVWKGGFFSSSFPSSLPFRFFESRKGFEFENLGINV